MNYRINPKNQDKLSILGFGCMRLSKNKSEAEQQIIHAVENGVNYFDTAYRYPNSEAILGSALSKGYRSQVKIATKMPPYSIKKYEDLDSIFNIQLERLQTDYIDYYLLHMLTDVQLWNKLVSIGTIEWLNEKKKNGKIVNFGFSYHGGREEFIRIIDAYDWDFCLIQYNYLDENNQAGKYGLHYAALKGLAVMVMEPLRGGKLVSNLPKEVLQIWENAYIKRSPAEWGLRWIWNQPEVTVVLSGINSMEMLDENIKTASQSEADSFTHEDYELFERVKKILERKVKVPCTGCNYCMPCPSGVDIPTCFSCYNDQEIEGKAGAVGKYIMRTGFKHNASLCKRCGICESHCPQKILIRDQLSQVTKSMEGILFKTLRFFMRRLFRIK